MSNSTPTVLERIRREAEYKAYANARFLGYDAVDAYREACEVGRFVNQMAEGIHVVER